MRARMRSLWTGWLILSLAMAGACGRTSVEPRFEIVYTDDRRPPAVVQTEPADEQQKTYRIALVSKISGIAYFNVAEDGAREAAKDLGVELISTGPQVADAKHQIEVVENLIKQQVDAIAIAANDPESLAPVMRKAREQGIEVITWDSDTVPEARTFFVNQVDAETLGRHLMDLLASRMNERGKYAIMTGSETALNLNEWIHWMEVQRSEYYPGLQLVDMAANDEDPRKAYAEALRLLERHPDLGGLVGVASISPPALARAVVETGREGEVIVVGVSTPELMRPYIKSGVAPVITLWSPKKLGYLTVYLAKQLLEGRMPYDGQKIPEVGDIRYRNGVVIMGEPLDFTKENVDEYSF